MGHDVLYRNKASGALETKFLSEELESFDVQMFMGSYAYLVPFKPARFLTPLLSLHFCDFAIFRKML